MLPSDELLAVPMVRNVLTPQEILLAEADEDWLVNDGMSDTKTVFTLSWDSSMPGSCGASWITDWRGIYFFRSSDLGAMGPFASLEEALDVEYLQSFFDYYSIESSVIPSDQLLALASKRFEGQEGDTIRINDETYELTETGLVPQGDQAGASA